MGKCNEEIYICEKDFFLPSFFQQFLYPVLVVVISPFCCAVRTFFMFFHTEFYVFFFFCFLARFCAFYNFLMFVCMFLGFLWDALRNSFLLANAIQYLGWEMPRTGWAKGILRIIRNIMLLWRRICKYFYYMNFWIFSYGFDFVCFEKLNICCR